MIKLAYSLFLGLLKAKKNSKKQTQEKFMADIPDSNLSSFKFLNNDYLLIKEYTEYGWQYVIFVHSFNLNEYDVCYLDSSKFTIDNVYLFIESILKRDLKLDEKTYLNSVVNV